MHKDVLYMNVLTIMSLFHPTWLRLISITSSYARKNNEQQPQHENITCSMYLHIHYVRAKK